MKQDHYIKKKKKDIFQNIGQKEKVEKETSSLTNKPGWQCE